MTGPLWTRMNAAPRSRLTSRVGIPSEPGVYAIYREGQPVYVGCGAGAKGLSQRIGNHLTTGPDLSRSAFRRNVCASLGIAPTSVTTIRPPQLSPTQIQPVNAWIAECQVAWLTCASGKAAKDLEEDFKREWMPPSLSAEGSFRLQLYVRW